MEQFREALEDVAKAALAELPSDPPKELVNTISFAEEGSVQYAQEERPDWSWALFHAVEAVKQTQPFQRLVEIVSADSDLFRDLCVDAAGNPISNDYRPEWIADFVRKFVGSYLVEHRAPTWDAAVFVGLFQELAEALPRTFIKFFLTAPLTNFEMVVDQVQLGPGVHIRRLSNDERRELFETQTRPWGSFIPTQELQEWKYAIFVEGQQQKHAPGSSDAPEIANVIYALRLCKDGHVGVGVTIRRDERFAPGFGGVHYTTGPLLYTRLGPTFTLLSEDSTDAETLFGRLISAPNEPRLWLALRRFNDQYLRLSLEDRLLDIWVALEALFLPDTTVELSYRASVRVASFLGNTKDERMDLFREVRASYNMRSHIIHGDSVAPADLAASVAVIHAVLRRVLRRWLDPAVPHDMATVEQHLLG